MEGEKSQYHHQHQEEDSYKECLRNHAASIGSYATDGCGEFAMLLDENAPGGRGMSTGLNCAACGCHRNFHLRVPSQHHHHHHHHHQEMMNTCNNRSSSSSPKDHGNNINNGKKRFRTKFTEEQKEKMLRFADEKLGWRMKQQRKDDDDDEMEMFCNGVGITS